jgi:hypothetical protein
MAACIVWANEGTWIAKKFRRCWQPMDAWHIIQCDLKVDLIIEHNPEVPEVFKYTCDVGPEDFRYEHVYYLDDQYNPFDYKVWVVKYRVANQVTTGIKDLGYIKPHVEFNPDIPQVAWPIDNKIPYYDLVMDHIWYLDKQFNTENDDIWVARIINPDSTGVKNMGHIAPIMEFNSDIPDVEWNIKDIIPYYDLNYTHVWYLDKQFNTQDDDIWVARIVNSAAPGVKHRGYIAPVIEFNPDIPKIAWPITDTIPYYDLNYTHVWYLDRQFNTEDDDIWLARIVNSQALGVKHMGHVAPVMEFNPDIPAVKWNITDKVPYYDLTYTHEWYLDKRFNPEDDNIWVARIVNPNNPNAAGVKHMGYVMPHVEFNTDIPNLDYDIADHVPYYDFDYELVWMLDSNLHTDDSAIWAAKIVPINEPVGVKVIGNIGVKIDQFDVVFISYNEPNAEANWYRLLEKFPKALRVKNVKGIFEAHKRAAEIARTPMFYVVDGDAEILDSFKFDFQPNIFDMDCVHLWTSRNPINGLEYGYGGVKLFPRQLLLDAVTWTVDLTTGLGKLKLVDKVSNMTAFNTDAFNTWRSAFRECAKLAASNDPAAEERLTTWCNHATGEFKFEALCGAQAGRIYGSANAGNLNQLKTINDYEWMKNEFNKFYGQ